MNPETQAAELLDHGVVVGSDGDELGKVGQVFLDNQSGQPSWVTVKTGWFGGNESFVPLDNASISGDRVSVPYDKDKIKGAPTHDTDAPLSEQDEDELYRYYGVGTSAASGDYASEYSSSGTATGDVSSADTGSVATGSVDTGVADADTGVRAAGYDTSGPETDNAITRSEEQLHVGTEKVEAGRARLRKFVVTEQQTVTVPVSHEEVRVEREAITDENRGAALSGADISEEEHEVVLTAERPVVTTEAVAVERVRLGTETVTEQQQVTGEVRKEQIELDGDGVGNGVSQQSGYVEDDKDRPTL